METLASRLVPEAVKNLIPYQSARRIGGQGHIWLNANELEQGCDYGEGSGAYHRYPDFLPHQLAERYLAYSLNGREVQDLEALAVRGADEAIDLLVRTFCQPGRDKVLVCPPTYAMYEFCAESFMVEAVKVPLLDNFQLNVPQICAQLPQAKLLFLCSPNNPTGNVIRQEDIHAILEASQSSTLVVVDEAYIEFAPDTTVVDLIAQYPNLVVIRTLSKAFGLAAVRCGFLLADPGVMTYVARLVAPYPIADPVAQISLSALSETGVARMRTQTASLIAVRDWFIDQVQQLPMVETVYPSATNFVLIRFRGPECIYSHLLDRGIVTRNQAHDPALNHCVRISVGSKNSMLETLNALKEYN
ncbi:histidinol-phosphate transaminase [Photobacterium atrarenae]|uniref:Histidinol-phosphate aminotransferase n=1 Tax=Photobacterium atrarenae TaxID=865757 RepID=A0ABY5GMJ3_9GAMM|nr:histidinol-phosphate transaminase [Photobacterium atrarenae]UTV29996.1 histidinol-phosphate transaminase [Photobacterium atrarenae]